MRSLLTGKFEDPAYATPRPNEIVEEPWTPEAHLAAARRLLDVAGKNGNQAAALLVAAARVHAEAAKTAGRTPTPVKTAPARTAPHDGDAI